MVRKILVINLMYIGDLLFTTPLLYTLHKNFPGAHISMLADAKNTAVIQHNPNISELIAIDKKGYHNKLPNYLRLIADIRRRKFDLVINVHANERASAIAAFSGAKQIIGFAARGFGGFFDCLIKERTDIHQADAYLEVLKAIECKHQDNQGLEMWVDDASKTVADKMWVQSFYSSIGDTKAGLRQNKVIGINTGGSWPTKRWTKIGFAKLADKLLERGLGVAFFGGPMDVADVQEIQSMMKQSQDSQLAIFTGQTTLLEMAALVKKCAVFVSGDSGPMHIAVSQKVPVVALFGPSNPTRYAPYGQKNAIIISKQECVACGKHSCETHSCMTEISVEKVLEYLAYYL